MYTATKSSPTPVEAVVTVSGQAEPLTYWTDARSSTVARPNPAVSNCGLVIVQVQPDVQRNPAHTQTYVTSSAEGVRSAETAVAPTYYAAETTQPGNTGQQQLTTWSNVTLDNRIFLTTTASGSSLAANQPLEDDDEGYRTSPGSDTSPQSINHESPPPKSTAKKMIGHQKLTRNGGVITRAQNSSHSGNEDSNNLMWLLDFKLDFFNEGQDGALIGRDLQMGRFGKSKILSL